MKKRVACFFTGGFTELNAMKTFVKHINDNVEYKQLCPISPRKNRDSIRNRTCIENTHSGLTGKTLIKYVLDSIEKTYFTLEKYDAILIEDDKDCRFFKEDGSTIDIDAWESFKISVRKQIESKGVNIPVIFLFAAPEVEAWFISDWDNSFGKVYKNELSGPQNKFFSTVFRKHVTEKILTKKYAESIESYGFFANGFKKLSEEIQLALNKNDFMAKYEPAFAHNPISYSKREHGEIMLENINPNIIQAHCTLFFKEAFFQLQELR